MVVIFEVPKSVYRQFFAVDRFIDALTLEFRRCVIVHHRHACTHARTHAEEKAM